MQQQEYSCPKSGVDTANPGTDPKRAELWTAPTPPSIRIDSSTVMMVVNYGSGGGGGGSGGGGMPAIGPTHEL